MAFFEALSGFLKQPVGNNLDNAPEDVKNTKRRLNTLGYFEDDTENDFITRDLDDGIKRFQDDNDLRIDGKLLPGGETERTIQKNIKRHARSDTDDDDAQDNGPLSLSTEIQEKDKGKDASPGLLSGLPDPAPDKNRETEQEVEEQDSPALAGFGRTAQNTDATGRMIRAPKPSSPTPPKPERKPETIAPTEKGNKLLDFIGKLESTDNYNVIYGGEEKPLTNMTVREVYALQKNMLSEGRKSSVVGKYQFKLSTLKETIDKLGINEDTLFDEKLQDKLARSRLEFRGFEKYKAGQISAEELIKRLANEWAALPADASNKSRYDGVLNNKALTDFKTLKDLIEKP